MQLHSYVWLGHTVVFLGIPLLPLVDELWHDMLRPWPATSRRPSGNPPPHAGIYESTAMECRTPMRLSALKDRRIAARLRSLYLSSHSLEMACAVTQKKKTETIAKVSDEKHLDFRDQLELLRNSRNLNAASLKFCFEDTEELLLRYFTQFSVQVNSRQTGSKR